MQKLLKLTLLIGFVLAVFQGWARAEKTADSPGYRIEVKVKGFTEDTMYLAYHMGDKQYMRDTVAVQDGRAVFEGAEPLEGGIYLVVLPPSNQYFEVIVTDDQEFTLSTGVEDLVGKMKVTGSEENTIFFSNLQTINGLGAQAETLEKQIEEAGEDAETVEKLKGQLQATFDAMNEARNSLIKDHPESFYAKVLEAMKDPEVPEAPEGAPENFSFYYYRAHYFDHLDFGDKRMLRTPVLHTKIMTYLSRLTVQHYDSIKVSVGEILDRAEADKDVFQYCAITLVNKYATSKVMCHDAVYVYIVDRVYGSGKAWWADEEQVKKITDRANSLRWTMCGNVAPQMMMADEFGNQQSMQGVKAKYTILYFWDYDCGHCKKITPEMAKLFPKFSDKDVALWTVSINGTEEKWKEKLKEYGLEDIGAINVSDHARKTGFDYFYDIRSTPKAFLLDEDKKILAKQIAPDQLEDLLNNLLGIELDDAEKEIGN